MTPKLLPHGASGIEFRDFVIEFTAGKIVVLAKGSGEHYTFHAGHASGILDVHRTWRDPTGKEHHQTVFAMRRADVAPLLNELMPMTNGMFRLFRRLRLGWLYRNDIGIVRGIDPITHEDFAAITKRRPGRRRIVFDEGQLRNNAQVPEYLDDIWDYPDGAFSLMRVGRRIAMGIKATDQSGFARLYWCKFRDVSRFFSVSQDALLAAGSKYAIPKGSYGAYDVLQP